MNENICINREGLFKQVKEMSLEGLILFGFECLKGAKSEDLLAPLRITRIFQILHVANEVCKDPKTNNDRVLTQLMSDLCLLDNKLNTGSEKSVLYYVKIGTVNTLVDCAKELYLSGEYGYGLQIVFACLRIMHHVASR